MSDRPPGRARRSLSRLRHISASKRGRLAFAVGSTVVGLVLVALAARHVSQAPLPFSRGEPTLLV
jgi:hypothetical protein